MLPRSHQIAAFVFVLLVAVGTGSTIAQIDLYWCPKCNGHHPDGHPHFQPPTTDPPPPPPGRKYYGVVTVYNDTSKAIQYTMQDRPGGSWYRYTVEPTGGSYYHWRTPNPAFRIRFDNSFASGYQSKTYRLDHNSVWEREPTRQEGRVYSFRTSGNGIDVVTGRSRQTRIATPLRPRIPPQWPVVPPKSYTPSWMQQKAEKDDAAKRLEQELARSLELVQQAEQEKRRKEAEARRQEEELVETKQKVQGILDELASDLDSIEAGSSPLFDGAERTDNATDDSTADGMQFQSVDGSSLGMRKDGSEVQLAKKDGAGGLRFKPIEVPSPVRSEPDFAGLRDLDEKELNRRIENTRRTLEQMGEDATRNVQELEHWLAESQDAEDKALQATLTMLKGTLTTRLVDKVKVRDPELADRIAKLARQIDTMLDVLDAAAAPPRDRETALRRVQGYLKNVYDVLRDETWDEIKKIKGDDFSPPLISLGIFLSDYSFEAARWNTSRKTIDAIVDGLDNPQGLLVAQKQLIKLNEALIQERNRRDAEKKKREATPSGELEFMMVPALD